jgi:hypothetical protein
MEAYLLEFLIAKAPPALTPAERLAAFRAWVDSHEQKNSPPLSDEAISRESIYGKRGL